MNLTSKVSEHPPGNLQVSDLSPIMGEESFSGQVPVDQPQEGEESFTCAAGEIIE